MKDEQPKFWTTDMIIEGHNGCESKELWGCSKLWLPKEEHEKIVQKELERNIEISHKYCQEEILKYRTTLNKEIAELKDHAKSEFDLSNSRGKIIQELKAENEKLKETIMNIKQRFGL